MGQHYRKPLLFLFIAVCIVLLVKCDRPSEQTSDTSNNSSTYLNHSDTATYVGMQKCRLCHQQIFDTFIQTGMGQSFAPATKQKSVASFNAHTVIYDQYQDFYYHPFWEGEQMKIMEFRLNGKDTVFKRIETVDYIIGSGQHTNSHIRNANGYLTQMPMTFFSQKKKWDFPPGFENGFNTHFNRKIGLECMSCHNALPGFVEGSENKFSAVPEGINCERCHGPGSIHVQQRSTGEKIDTSKYIDYSIVNPGKLPIDRQFDVCQRCHLQGNAVLKNGKSFFDFRPGMVLSDYISVFLPKYENADDEFIMASHADRLKQSQCFIKSFKSSAASSLKPYKNALTCVTCHNPHVSINATNINRYNNACKNCHTSTSNTLCTESITVRSKKQDNCVSCHMPRSGSIDIPHVSIHDHYIRKPEKKENIEKIKKFIGLFSVNEKNPSNALKARAYIQQYDKFDYNIAFLDSASHYLSDKTVSDIRANFGDLVQLYFIKKEFNKILSYVQKTGKDELLKSVLIKKSWSNDDAWTSYRIGEAFYSKNDLANASLFYENAIQLSPYNTEFKNKMGSLLLSQNNTMDAIKTFEEVLVEAPQNIQAITNLGYANLLIGKVAEADRLYANGLKLDPDYEPLLMNVAGLYIFKKQYKEASYVLKTIILKNPKNIQAKQVLEQLKNM
ncbi:MAG TPA: tetratricopeptide repeat protein [Bacteroidia bacterium]|nr:tetratricopeptide repeat protein [Bacteroidia bacterium]HRG51441.1 tetratricopeptide repeat protein [Bacteroidia bacterium]